jgi:NDP-sugar pyrophosphorylase family protein
MKPSLLIMAAGMGSRYGGLKQMEALGPSGATLLDYSIHDAIRSGFGKVVFVIRHDIEADFKRIVGKKWESHVPVRYVFQELGMVPEGFKTPPARQKPWGTGHAIWVARGAVKEPFAAINADDYYGRHSFKVLAGHLKKIKKLDKPDYSMVGFKLKNTLSEHGTVSRGVCEITSTGFLKKVVERLKIEKAGTKARYLEEDGNAHPLKGTETVSMNMWGFTPLLFEQLGERFEKFLKEKGGEEKSEFLIPRVVDDLVRDKEAKVRVLSTRDQWFGITYPEDKAKVRQSMEGLGKKGVYPERLW